MPPFLRFKKFHWSILLTSGALCLPGRLRLRRLQTLWLHRPCRTQLPPAPGLLHMWRRQPRHLCRPARTPHTLPPLTSRLMSWDSVSRIVYYRENQPMEPPISKKSWLVVCGLNKPTNGVSQFTVNFSEKRSLVGFAVILYWFIII